MPVRIYDISKKLGLENKEVLSKAKELGIAAARVASSSLDKITAEYPRGPAQAHPSETGAPPAGPGAAPRRFARSTSNSTCPRRHGTGVASYPSTARLRGSAGSSRSGRRAGVRAGPSDSLFRTRTRIRRCP